MRLGELVNSAKNGSFHKFHTFGDPALRLPFPKVIEDLIQYMPNPIPQVEEQEIDLSFNTGSSAIFIKGKNIEVDYNKENDNLTYTIPGHTYSQINSSNPNICFRIPLDASICDSCAIIHIYQEDNSNWNGNIQTYNNISIIEAQIHNNRTPPNKFRFDMKNLCKLLDL